MPKLPKKIVSIKPGSHHETGPGGLSADAFAAWYRKESLVQWHNLDMRAIDGLAKKILEAEKKKRNIFVMGNGGSAATASHWATDLSKTARVPGRPLLRCQSLAENVAYLTAIANDISFDDSFSLQLENVLMPNDLVILISGSGNSRNLIKACLYAKKRRAFVVGLLGFDGGRLKDIADLSLLVPSQQYGVIEDMHMAIGHILTFYLKQRR